MLYRRKGSILVLHRVVKRKGGQFYMAGDNQTEVEGPVEADQIRGILTAFVRNGRRISVKNPVYVIWSGLWLMFLPVRGIFWSFTAWVRRLRKIIQNNFYAGNVTGCNQYCLKICMGVDFFHNYARLWELQ